MNKKRISEDLTESPKFQKISSIGDFNGEVVSMVFSLSDLREAVDVEAKLRSTGGSVNGGFFNIVVEAKYDEFGRCLISAGIEVNITNEKFGVCWSLPSVQIRLRIVHPRDLSKSKEKIQVTSFSYSESTRWWDEILSFSDTDFLDEFGRVTMQASACVIDEPSACLFTNGDCKDDGNFMFSGLQNLGATCYLNGLIQSLFFLGDFREIVYRGSGDDEEEFPILPALRKVFYELECGIFQKTGVSCLPLVSAFGWDTLDVFIQHDVQELNRVLLDGLEEALKASGHDKNIRELFEGRIETYVDCIDVNFKSTREETFYDLQLNLFDRNDEKPIKSLEDALVNYTCSEILEGVDAYEAEGYGKQRAKKGVQITEFPPILSLQLLRFKFDMEIGDFSKINDFLEFPETLKKPLGCKYNYFLHSVLVHAGDVSRGHYYCFARPNGPGSSWYKFDDEVVRKVRSSIAVEDNFGGKIYSAYLLMYVREDFSSNIFRSPRLSDLNVAEFNRLNEELIVAKKSEAVLIVRIFSKECFEKALENNLIDSGGFLFDEETVPSQHHREIYVSSEDATRSLYDILEISTDERILYSLIHNSLVKVSPFHGSANLYVKSSRFSRVLVLLELPGDERNLMEGELAVMKKFDCKIKKIVKVSVCFFRKEDFLLKMKRWISDDLEISEHGNFKVFLAQGQHLVEVLDKNQGDFAGNFFIYHSDCEGKYLTASEFMDERINSFEVQFVLVSMETKMFSCQAQEDKIFRKILIDLRKSAMEVIEDIFKTKDVFIFRDCQTESDYSEIFWRAKSYDWTFRQMCEMCPSFPKMYCFPYADKFPGDNAWFLSVRNISEETYEEIDGIVMEISKDKRNWSLADLYMHMRNNGKPKVDFARPVRFMEISHYRIHCVYYPEDFEKISLNSLLCSRHGNFFYNFLRVENFPENFRTSFSFFCQFENFTNHPFILHLPVDGKTNIHEVLAKKVRNFRQYKVLDFNRVVVYTKKTESNQSLSIKKQRK